MFLNKTIQYSALHSAVHARLSNCSSVGCQAHWGGGWAVCLTATAPLPSFCSQLHAAFSGVGLGLGWPPRGFAPALAHHATLLKPSRSLG